MKLVDHYDLRPAEFYAKAPGLPDRIPELMRRTPRNIIMQTLNIGCGVEVELENVVRKDKLLHWKVVDDNSLRGNGAEFVSELGIRIWNTPSMLAQLMAMAKFNKYTASDRTSIHVHINVQNLHFEQLNSLIILYTIFERALFRFSTADRHHNIFCVPIISSLGERYKTIYDFITTAQKYNALNISAVQKYGTVEFRHMGTVWEADHICNWIMLLGLLKRAAAHIPLEELKDTITRLKYESDYLAFMRTIFYGYTDLLEIIPEEVDQALSDSKLFFFEA